MRMAVMGASGRMGQMLVRLIDESDQATLSAVVERAGHDWIGRDLGQVMGGAARGIVVTDEVAAALAASDAIIDFTSPAVSVALAQAAAVAGVAHVIGTTGFSEVDLATIAESGERGRIVRAGNMSLGVNLLVTLTRQVAAALGAEYDIEIVEAHHRHKVDAPSGTALMLGEAAAEGRGVALGDVADRGRDGITGARETGAIGFHAIRGGDFIGEHDVIFAGEGERITLRHVASDRALFARGALKAALWLDGKGPGEYSMLDVLGLSSR
ncbi:4-hydroxy-tetrahydrodipicolinate reductase [Natronohydrobacter thiooxidans]|uniref:4-hydroxy-tetrahydrodipicolinate reductase n=1 Tax=Natronohydrobacter thiooxidans TaxID=87172 RepID=UPI0008FF1605|nr:4-hydroxy-tetrahydrodipicolinate reductase [Natronohydrobacter thiooxidans]